MVINKTDMTTGKLLEQSEISKNCWIHLMNPDDSEVDFVSAATGIPEQMLKTALDEEESAHIDREDGTTMVVIDIPIIEDEEDWYVYNTIPLGIMYNKDYFVTVCLKDTSIVRDFQSERVKNFATFKQNKFLLQILYLNATKFLQHLRQIDRTSNRVQNELHKSMKNKELIQLLDLEKSLVYFSTGLRANDAVLIRVSKFESLQQYPEDLELLEDVMIENRQAIEMCNIYRDILSGTMDAFASVISNNVNIVMKMLTIITIIISIPTLISGFWGMNVPVPFEGTIWGFAVVALIAVVVTAVCTFFLVKKSNTIRMTGRRRKRDRKK